MTESEELELHRKMAQVLGFEAMYKAAFNSLAAAKHAAGNDLELWKRLKEFLEEELADVEQQLGEKAYEQGEAHL